MFLLDMCRGIMSVMCLNSPSSVSTEPACAITLILLLITESSGSTADGGRMLTRDELLCPTGHVG